MGRKRNVIVREFFTFSKNLNASICKVCSAKFIGENITNLKRHMTMSHNELYKLETEEFRGSWEEERDKQKTKFSMEMSRNEVIDIYMDFLTKQSLPLTFFDSNAFQTLTHQIFEGLKMEPINSQNICEILNDRYDKIKSNIIKSIKGHLVSIKLDMVTFQERSILCINMQILKNQKLLIYTLAVKDIGVRATKEYLQNILEQVMEDYELSTQQIYTVTIDNGENIFKDFDIKSSFNNEDQDAANGEEKTFQISQPELIIKEEGGEVLNASKDSLLLLTDIMEESSSSVIILKSTNYVIQLASQDFFKEPDIDNIIQQSLHAIGALRSSAFDNTLHVLNLEKPIKVNTKNWISIFIMLENLLKFKDLCSKPIDPLEKDTKDVMLQHIKEPLKKLKWTDIEELIMILKPVYECTLMLQKQQLFLIDFYKSWLTLKSTLKSQNTKRSSFLYSCLEKRESQLMNNEIFNAARFLDPLFFRSLNPYEKDNARQHLKELIEKIIDMKTNNPSPSSGDPNRPTTSGVVENDSTDEASNSPLLKELYGDYTEEEANESETNRQFKKASNEIDLYNPPQLDVDLMQYWDKQKYRLPYLKQLANVIHAVPATQVSIEKAFIALQFVLDKQKENLSNDLMYTIIFLKLNSDTK